MCVFYIRGHFKGARWEATDWGDLQFSQDLGGGWGVPCEESRTAFKYFFIIFIFFFLYFFFFHFLGSRGEGSK